MLQTHVAGDEDGSDDHLDEGDEDDEAEDASVADLVGGGRWGRGE